MTGPQPNPIHALEAEAAEQATHAEETHGGAPYTGDMPDDPEQAVHYRPGQDEQDPDDGGADR